MKIKRSFKIKIDMTTVKAKRFFVGFFYANAGFGVCGLLDSISERSWLGLIDLAIIILSIRFGNESRRELEGEVGVDQYLEGYKHGLSTRNGR